MQLQGAFVDTARNTRRQVFRAHLLTGLVLLLFSLVGVLRHLHNYGEDLASSYVGCRLLAEDQGNHLYSHSATNFSQVNDPTWDRIAVQAGFFPLSQLHPYVQTPLWAYLLEPACTRLRFRAFCDLYIVLFMLCTSGLLLVVARYWTPSLLHPLPIALIYLGLYRSEPFKYAIFLAQTHILYIFMAVVALVLAERRHPTWAGVLLALAAAVKLTPGLLVIYWLILGRYRSCVAFVLVSAALVLGIVPLLGAGMLHAYLSSLQQTSGVLLLAFNNQSFAAWWQGLFAPRTAMLHWYIHPLSRVLKDLSLSLMVVCTVLGGLLDRKATREPPYGAAFALVGITLFAPVAWTHYFIILVVPVMFFVQASGQQRRWLWGSVAAVILLLNLYPISFGSVHFTYHSFTIVRSQFYAGMLTLVALWVLGKEAALANTQAA